MTRWNHERAINSEVGRLLRTVGNGRADWRAGMGGPGLPRPVAFWGATGGRGGADCRAGMRRLDSPARLPFGWTTEERRGVGASATARVRVGGCRGGIRRTPPRGLPGAEPQYLCACNACDALQGLAYGRNARTRGA